MCRLHILIQYNLLMQILTLTLWLYLMVQLSENIILYNQLNKTGFILNTDFDSISQMDRSVDAFN